MNYFGIKMEFDREIFVIVLDSFYICEIKSQLESVLICKHLYQSQII